MIEVDIISRLRDLCAVPSRKLLLLLYDLLCTNVAQGHDSNPESEHSLLAR